MLNNFWRKTIPFDTMVCLSRWKDTGLPHWRFNRLADLVGFTHPQVGRSIVKTLSTSTKSR